MIGLENALRERKIEYRPEDIDAFEKYMEGVLAWNEKVNLTAITARDEFIKKHFLDSLMVCSLYEFSRCKRVIDIGTGAGFPGIPLAIINRDKEFILADSLNKRIKIVRELAGNCGIENITAIHGRAEDLGHQRDLREQFDVCVSRAVANLSVLCEYALPFVKLNGFFLAYKGPEIDDEIEKAKKSISTLGGMVERVEEVDLDGYRHNILIIKKIKCTPAKYPRKAGMPSKEPI